jgi:predicted O-linked N-acetylglucosamine transferase (SPINDLY family)
MPTNKVDVQNSRIIERTEKSVFAEQNFYKTKKEEEALFKSNERNRVLEYQQSMEEKSNKYAKYWIYEKGDRARLIINAYFDNKTSKDPCFVNVYNKREKLMEKHNFLEVVKMTFEDAKDSPGNRLGQTRIWGDLYLSTEIYKFMKVHWESLKEGSSEC